MPITSSVKLELRRWTHAAIDSARLPDARAVCGSGSINNPGILDGVSARRHRRRRDRRHVRVERPDQQSQRRRLSHRAAVEQRHEQLRAEVP
jgi:hypothetical protein